MIMRVAYALVIGLTMVFGILPLSFSHEQIQVNRYNTVTMNASPSQINPLLMTVQFKFPDSVATVGDAVAYALRYSGYRLVALDKQSSVLKAVLSQPLPISDRDIGPLSLKTALVVLVGQPVFTLVMDPVHRVVNFELKPHVKLLYQGAPHAHA